MIAERKLPTGWAIEPIDHVLLDVQYGLSLLSNENGNVAIVGMKGLIDGRIVVDPSERVTLSDSELDTYLLRNGDILLNRTNSPALVGKTSIFRGTEDAVFASYLVRLNVNRDKANPDFINHLLNSDAGQRKLKMLSTRAVSQANINPTVFRGHFHIPLPPLAEQKIIADLLNCWDSAIEKTEQLIAVKQERLQPLAHQALTGRKRIHGFSSRWPFLRAGDIFENISRKGYTSEPLLSVTQERGVIPRDMLEGRVTMPSGETGTFKLVEPGNFVISLRSFQGGLEHSAFRGLVSPAYTVLRAMREIDERFFRHYFRSVDFIKRLSVAVIGIRDGKQVSFQDFCSIKLPFPPIEEQRAIAAMLDCAEQEIELLCKQAATFRKQKRGLMQKLLTGQWRVKVPKEVCA